MGKFIRQLEQMAYDWQPDALQLHEYQLLPAGRRIKNRLGIPLVYDVQDSHLEMWAVLSRKPPPFKQIYNMAQALYERHYLKQADKVTCHSKMITTRYTGWGADAICIPNYPRLRPVESIAIRQPVVIYHGQLAMHRGLDVLLDAFGRVTSDVTEARLQIIGWEQRPGVVRTLEQLAQQLGIAGQVEILPPRSYLDILDHLTTASVGVIPFLDRPLYRVAPPNKMYEYFLTGCAVVSSDLPILREEGREAARYVPPGDADALARALTQLLMNPDERKERAKAGRNLAETIYHWERVEPDFLAVYSSLA
jgi:glycosyltransferase involved in cell wall biosynthesis